MAARKAKTTKQKRGKRKASVHKKSEKKLEVVDVAPAMPPVSSSPQPESTVPPQNPEPTPAEALETQSPTDPSLANPSEIQTSTPQAAEVADQKEEAMEPPIAEETPPVVPQASIVTPSQEDRVLESTPSGSVNKKKIVIVLAFVAVAAGLTFALLSYRQQFITRVATQPVNPTVAQKPTPLPTQATVDMSKYTIEVLNGSGIAGEAGRAKVSLEKENFKVSSIGNADKSDYAQTSLVAKKTVDENFLKKLKSVLKKTYDLSDTAASSSVSLNTDVVIVLGNKKAP